MPVLLQGGLGKIDVIAVWFAELCELDGIRLTDETTTTTTMTTTTAHRYQWAVTLIKLDLDARNSLSLSPPSLSLSLSLFLSLNPISVCIVPNYCKQPRSRERHRASIGLGDMQRIREHSSRAYTQASKFKIPPDKTVSFSAGGASERTASKRDQLLLSNERFTSRVITGNCDEPSRRRENDDSKVLRISNVSRR